MLVLFQFCFRSECISDVTLCSTTTAELTTAQEASTTTQEPPTTNADQMTIQA